ncbi:lysogenization protein HflD [Lysobacter sp. Root667]|uniref:high frequency lysogenization protein HflD n=1 Tax=Lysobacter sp. Root667 TaxID=1736581 RepID=UPI0006FAF2F6|nr:high frequency lysogenization protein HflD [Lysobacter sp. Root667]KRA74489.1 lysogenization protein HflD [Lysobacter sp. Root667]
MSSTPSASPASKTISERVLALAGLVQALAQVRRIADTGQANAAVLGTALDSVFRIDASSLAQVYGGVEALRPGLVLLRDYFVRETKDEQLPRLALAVMQLERRFVRDHDMAQRVQAGILAQSGAAERLGSGHPDVLAGLGGLYAETLSHLRPRVLVQGNPHYLGQASVVAEVRAVLLAAVRSAVLWRQLGGSLWDFLLRRRDMIAALNRYLD